MGRSLWRPGGPFEYPPALATLQVAALPVVLSGMLGRPRGVAVAAAAAGALAAETIALTTSRFALAAAAAVAVATLLGAPASRRSTAAAVALLVVAGLAAEAVAGGSVGPREPPDEVARLLALAGVAAACTVAWSALRAWVPAATAPRPVSVALSRRFRSWPVAAGGGGGLCPSP